MTQLSLDPASLQAIRELTDATKASATVTKAQAQQQTQQLIGLQHGLNNLGTHAQHGNGWQASHAAQLQNLANLQQGQAMGMRLWQNPVNGDMHWIPGGKGGGGGGGAGGAGGGKGGGAGGAGAGGLLQAAGLGGLSRLVAPLAIAHTAFNAVTTAGGLINDKYIGGAQAERNFIRQVVPFGGTVMDGLDSVTGRKSKMEQLDVDHQIETQRAEIRGERRGFDLHAKPQLAGVAATAQAYREQAPALPPVIENRGTAAGEQQYRDAQRALPYRQASLAAERDLRKAIAERSEAEVQANAILRRRSDLEVRIGEARKAADRVKSYDPSEEKRYLLRADALKKEYDSLHAPGIAAETQLREKKIAQGAAQANRDKAVSREEKIVAADRAQDQADRAKGTAMALGQMNPAERSMAVQAVLMGKKYGIDALSPEMKQQFAALAPKEFEAAALKAGAASEGYAQLQQGSVIDAPGGRSLFGVTIGGGNEPGMKPQEFQKKADTLRKESAESDFQQDSAAAGVAEKAGERFAEVVGKMFDRAIEMMSAAVETKMRIGKNN